MRVLPEPPGRVRYICRRIWSRITSPGGILRSGTRAMVLIRNEGPRGLWRRVMRVDALERDYPRWIAEYDILADSDRAAIRTHIGGMTHLPRVSIAMPVYNTPEPWLRAAIASVVAQIYPDWELCIVDDASDAAHVRPILEQAAARDSRIRLCFRSTNGGIAAASNDALNLATGDYVGLLDHDDALSDHALYIVAAAIEENPDLDFLYSDEDKLDPAGRRCLPYFKPDWNPDLLLNQNYVTHFAVYRKAFLGRIGGFRGGFEGSQDFDLILRAAEHTPAERIRHLPFVLYHWRMIAGSTAVAVGNKSHAITASRLAIEDALARRQIGAHVEPGLLPDFLHVAYELPEPQPLVSVIIPTRDGGRRLRACVDSLLAVTTYRNFEVILLDNASGEADTLTYLEYLRRTAGSTRADIRVISWPHPFNYSDLNNFGARHAKGEVLCLMNDDIEIVESRWLDEMTGHALRPEVGAVGARLLYPDGTLQHAGIGLGLLGSAGYFFKHFAASQPSMGLRTFVVQNVSAVTGACLVLRRAVFDEVSGLDSAFSVVFNDVDLCLRIGQRGYRIVWTPYATLIHHESATRGADDTPEKRAMFERGLTLLRERWGASLVSDPAYNPNLILEREDGGLAFPPRARKPWHQYGAALTRE